VLIDPGDFAWNSGLVKLDTFPKLAEIIVTHEHGDHFHEPFVKALHEAFPDVKWVTNSSVADKLKELGITNVTTDSTDITQVEPLDHARLPYGEGLLNIAVHVFDKLSHPGDSHALPACRDILALPFSAPWGSTTAAIDMARSLTPKQVIPIHDAFWKEDFLAKFHERSKVSLAENGIDFIIPVNGQVIEL
jgi:L-ascorbate metabolism protein UlaG (beta-lactamase superfamily)